MTLFRVKVKFDKIMENGIVKRVTENYLVKAISFSEAENKIYEWISHFYKEVEIADISKAKIGEIFRDEDGDRYYNVKCAFITINEKTAKEKKDRVNILVQASDIDQAKKTFSEGMKGTLSDWVAEAVVETNIIDIVDDSHE